MLPADLLSGCNALFIFHCVHLVIILFHHMKRYNRQQPECDCHVATRLNVGAVQKLLFFGMFFKTGFEYDSCKPYIAYYLMLTS